MPCSIDKCTGCGACANICPVDCIQMQKDGMGFYVPHKNEKCIDCGLCDRVCPIINPGVELDGRIKPKLYAVEHKKIDVKKMSASGGAFILLADYIIEKGGVVWGTTFDSDFLLKYQCAETKEEVRKFCGSKYLQGVTGDSFQKVKKQLEDGKTVLFCGIPCQILGLQKYLENVDRTNLYTVDIVCGGGASEKVFFEYKEEMEKELGKIISINQTAKYEPWAPLIFKNLLIKKADGTEVKKSSANDAYLTGYFNGNLLRRSCTECPGASLPRCADITIGDFFGLGAIRKYKFHDEWGVSMLMVNTEHGEHLFNACKENSWYEERRFEEILPYNEAIWRPARRDYTKAEMFYKDLEHLTFEEIQKKYLESSSKVKKQRKVKEILKKILGYNNVARGIYCVKLLNGTVRKSINAYKKMEDVIDGEDK